MEMLFEEIQIHNHTTMNSPDFTRVFDQFQEVEATLHGMEDSSRWITQTSYFPSEEAPQGVAIQLSRQGWFNEEGKGIHFETWITEKELASKKLKFVMHVLHQDTFPGTGKKAWDFLWPFLEDATVINFVESWKGFKMGRSVPIKGERKFADAPQETVLAEFSHFMELGERIDNILESVLS